MEKMLRTLRISEQQVLATTLLPSTLDEVNYRQEVTRGLINVSDEVFSFFMELYTFVNSLTTTQMYSIHIANFNLFCRGQIQSESSLLEKWMSLFQVKSDSDDDDSIVVMMLELYEMITEYFLRICISDSLVILKESIHERRNKPSEQRWRHLANASLNHQARKLSIQKQILKRSQSINAPFAVKSVSGIHQQNRKRA